MVETFVPRPKPTLETLFAECDKRHRIAVTNLATMCEKPVMTVYGWWREYCETCSTFDQSAVWPEFLTWYKDKIGLPDAAAVAV